MDEVGGGVRRAGGQNLDGPLGYAQEAEGALEKHVGVDGSGLPYSVGEDQAPQPHAVERERRRYRSGDSQNGVGPRAARGHVDDALERAGAPPAVVGDRDFAPRAGRDGVGRVRRHGAAAGRLDGRQLDGRVAGVGKREHVDRRVALRDRPDIVALGVERELALGERRAGYKE